MAVLVLICKGAEHLQFDQVSGSCGCSVLFAIRFIAQFRFSATNCLEVTGKADLFYTLKNMAQDSHAGSLLILQLHFPADIQGTREEFKKSRTIDTVRGARIGLSWRFVVTHRGFRDKRSSPESASHQTWKQISAFSEI